MLSEMLEEKIVRVTEILEQIEELNHMIDLHREHKGDASTISQYEYMREKFVHELNELFRAFKLNANFSLQAA